MVSPSSHERGSPWRIIVVSLHSNIANRGLPTWCKVSNHETPTKVLLTINVVVLGLLTRLLLAYQRGFINVVPRALKRGFIYVIPRRTTKCFPRRQLR